MDLKELRVLKALTQKELGRRIGVSQQYISKLENGNVPWIGIIIIYKLSKALEIDALDLCELFINQIEEYYLLNF